MRVFVGALLGMFAGIVAGGAACRLAEVFMRDLVAPSGYGFILVMLAIAGGSGGVVFGFHLEELADRRHAR